MELALFTTSFLHQYFQQTQLLWISLVVYWIRLHMDITRSWNQIDYILCSQKWRSSIHSAKTRLEVDCGSDHELLIAKLRLKLKKVGKSSRPFRYDLKQIPYDYTVEVISRSDRQSAWRTMDRGLWHCTGGRDQNSPQEKLGRPRGIGWRGRWEGGSGWGIHVNPWLIHVNVWQKPLQYCKVISLQLIKINLKKGKMVVWGSLTNSWEKKRRERQRRKGKIFPFECRVLKNSKER